MGSASRRVFGPVVLALTLAFAGCQREERDFRTLPASTVRTGTERYSTLQPGPPSPDPAVRSPYDDNAYGLSQGQRLYVQWNCNGCHAYGGGDIGPPLMDERWIYGSAPENIFASIIEGRPNGMPSFAGRVPDHQVWQIVAYVRSMGRLTPKDAAPGRPDSMFTGEPPVSKEVTETEGERAEHLP